MPATATENSTVVRNDRGLSIRGTRLTLYDIMDYVKDEWPPKLIRDWFNLTQTQIDDVMDYINENRAQVEAESQQVLKRAEEIERYWEKRNRERMSQFDPDKLSPERRALWDKLQAWKARIGQP